MLGKVEIDRIAEEIIAQMHSEQKQESFAFEKNAKVVVGGSGVKGSRKKDCAVEAVRADNKLAEAENIDFAEEKNKSLLENPEDPDALHRMMQKTIARIGVGKAGPRLKTKTMLSLRADHAAARDAVMMDVSEELVKQLGLLPLVTKCSDKNEFLTRPDLGRDFDDKMKKYIKDNCKAQPDVQIIVSDGLSSTAIEANAARILPVVLEGLKEKGITVGTPVFVKFGRVGAQDRISELLDAKIVCSFIGERPGLATAESMSAYITYRAEVGMPEARRTVVSNIHKNGVPAVEAGAYIVDLLQLMLEQKASGLDLKK